MPFSSHVIDAREDVGMPTPDTMCQLTWQDEPAIRVATTHHWYTVWITFNCVLAIHMCLHHFFFISWVTFGPFLPFSSVLFIYLWMVLIPVLMRALAISDRMCTVICFSNVTHRLVNYSLVFVSFSMSIGLLSTLSWREKHSF